MNGTNATTFEPNAALNRVMEAQILYNLEGQPNVIGGEHLRRRKRPLGV